MKPLLQRILLRGAGCALLAWIAWRLAGPTGLLFAACAYGLALARPLVELAGELLQLIRASAYAGVEGRYYAYRGTPMHVVEDDEHQRWLRVADVRKVLGRGASDGALEALYGAECRRLGARREAYLGAEALLRQLGRDSRAEAGRFRLWVEREVAFPARQLRSRAGSASRA